MIGTAFIFLAAVGSGLAVVGMFSSSKRANRRTPPASGLTGSPTPTTAVRTTTTVTTTVSPAPSEAATRPMIATVVADYQSDFARKNLHALQGILAPDVVRRGLAAGSHSCVVTRGRAAVTKVYAGEVGHGYSLVGDSANRIQFQSPGEAKLNARYKLASGATGSVDFTLVDIDGAWKISAVSATC